MNEEIEMEEAPKKKTTTPPAKKAAPKPVEEEPEEDEGEEEGDDDELDLDNLEQCTLETLKKYCEDEEIAVKGTKKADYIKAIIAYNDQGEDEEEH